MVRSLPKRHNPLILPEASPDYEELLARRRLGKTHLAVKPAQVGTSNATKPENLGPFEYAHLRAPLPKDLRGSEIFPSHSPQQHPETYFLMRRSKDGYISATGMFKIAFPWAKLEEERAEREYLKSRKETSEDEIAGNIWISPMFALELAKEYRMFDWVRALLDSREIVQSPSTAKKQITPPPKFEMPPMEPTSQLPPASRTRSRRSASPSKKLGSPRKSRQTRSAKEANVAAPTAASATLQSALDTAASTADSESVDGAVEQNGEVNVEEKVAEEPEQKTETKSESKETAATEVDEKVKEDAENTVEVRKDVEASQTSVSVEMPVSLPEPPPPEDMEKMIAKAKEMVEEATKQQAEAETAAASSSSPNAAKKRKSDELVEEGEEQIADVRAQPTKKARVLEEKLRRERVRNRALVGVTATLALA
ncbi:putative apses transcription factor [Thermoascus aurantiacus ATCC 26904]